MPHALAHNLGPFQKENDWDNHQKIVLGEKKLILKH